MYPELFVGLDIHRKTIFATALDGQGQQIDQRELSSADADLIGYLQGLQGNKHVVLEACNVWEHVFDAAQRAGAATVTLANPLKTRMIAEASLTSDKVDSATLAELLRLKGIPKSYAPDPGTRQLRQLVRDRLFYKRHQTSVKNHIYAVLIRKGIPYEDGLLNLRRKRGTLRELNIPAVTRGLDMLNDIQEVCKELDASITEAFRASKEAQLLGTIPGIGELTSVALVAELCPIDRFPNVEKVSSYVGLVPTNAQSADRVFHGRMKKDCVTHLKTLLIQAAHVHRRLAKTSDVAKIGRRVSRRGGKGKGSAAAAHKLLKMAYAVLKRGTPWTPKRPSHVETAAAS